MSRCLGPLGGVAECGGGAAECGGGMAECGGAAAMVAAVPKRGAPNPVEVAECGVAECCGATGQT